jgi:glycolate oxidase FAD binding subunit
MNWPENEAGGFLGRGRYALATDRPESVDALRGVVIERTARGEAIYPQGGRTALDYGGVPGLPGVAIDTRSLNRVIDYPAADMTVTLEAGMTLAELRRVLAERGQRLPLDAPEGDRATLGGIFATNASGPRRFGWGRPRDWIIGVGFVTAAGELVKGGGRVVKNVAGYDFPRLLTGSMGTLGIIVQLTLKTRPIAESTAIVWASFDRGDDAREALARLTTSATRPTAIELLNRPAATAIGEPSGLPAAEWTIAIGFEGARETVAWQTERLAKELNARDCRSLEADSAEALWSRLVEDSAAKRSDYEQVSIVVNARRSAVVGLALKLDSSVWGVQAHAGNGIIRAKTLRSEEPSAIEAAVSELRRAAVEAGGNLIVSGRPEGRYEGLPIWGEPRDDWAIARRIKEAFDPRGLMNPGRFVGGI